MGSSVVLYEIPDSKSLKQAVSAGYLTEDGAEVIRQIVLQDPNTQQFDPEETVINIFPTSLQLSPDRTRIAWQEAINYCVAVYDFFNCTGETIIHVFNIETKMMESTFSIPLAQESISTPIWSPDSKKLAYYTFSRDTEESVIHILDIVSSRITDVEGSQNFVWTPDSQKMIFSRADGLYLLTLGEQKDQQILEGEWWIEDLALSPDGNSIAIAGIKDFDDPTTPYFDDRIGPSYELIYILNLETNVLRSIPNPNNDDWIGPIHWLPGGQRIIYTQKFPSEAAPSWVFVFDYTPEKFVLAQTLPFGVSDDWHVSQDGKKILFVASRFEETTLLVIYDLETREWSKLALPAKIQEAMNADLKTDKRIKHYRLWFATW